MTRDRKRRNQDKRIDSNKKIDLYKWLRNGKWIIDETYPRAVLSITCPSTSLPKMKRDKLMKKEKSILKGQKITTKIKKEKKDRKPRVVTVLFSLPVCGSLGTSRY